jgi:hypothetical protein
MRLSPRIGTALALFLIAATSAVAQQPPATTTADNTTRDATREKLRKVLDEAGKRADVNAAFRQSTKQPYNFVGQMFGMPNVDSLEIVVSVTPSDTIGFRIYPHYKGAYINLDKAKDANGLMRKLLTYNDRNFLFWGADATNDVFCGYTFTLESGFPDNAIVIVLRSIRNADGFVGEMRPMIDGTSPAPPAGATKK